MTTTIVRRRRRCSCRCVIPPFAVVAIMAGLLPIMWGSGTGSEVMSRIAAPMVGGMISAPLLSMLVVPVVYRLMRRSSAGQLRS